MKLAHYSDQILWTPTQECAGEGESWPDADEINNMIELAEEQGLRILAHNQVSGNMKFFVGRLEDEDWDVFINPEVMVDDLDDYIFIKDTCPHSGVTSAFKRYRKLTLRWADLGGNMYEREFTGVPASDIQAAVNRLEGRDFAHLDQLGDWGKPHRRYAR